MLEGISSKHDREETVKMNALRMIVRFFGGHGLLFNAEEIAVSRERGRDAVANRDVVLLVEFIGYVAGGKDTGL